MIGNRSYSNFESQAHGTIDIPKALEVSCDTVFYRWAYDAWVKAGGVKASTDAPDPYASVAREFGYGARTGVDLPAEASGSIPDRATKRREWEATKAASCRRAKSGYPEIADKLGCSTAAARRCGADAIAALRHRLIPTREDT